MEKCNAGIACGCSCCEKGIQLTYNDNHLKYICDYYARPHHELDRHECIAYKTRPQNTQVLVKNMN